MAIPLIFNPIYSYPFPDKHRFPMQKFRYLYEICQTQGIAQKHNVFQPGKLKRDQLDFVHCPDYTQRFLQNTLSSSEQRRMGLPWTEGLAQRTLVAPNGSLLAASIALNEGIACHLAGGTHHAHYDFGSGYCVFNDLVVAAKVTLAKGSAKRILIFDCDVHQGDGTAAMCRHDDNIFTCSIHCEKNFPFRKQPSDLDIGLAKGITDQTYLNEVEKALNHCLDNFQPDLVLYDAGVDIYTNDPLGLINISEVGIRARDHLVLSTLKNKSIPVATVIGGGYADDEKALAKRHAIVVAEAHALHA